MNRGYSKLIHIRKCAAYLACALSVCAYATNVHAIEYSGLGARPAHPRPDNPRTESIFVHTLEPKQNQDEDVIVINNTGEKKTLYVYAADSTPSSGGGFACKQLLDTQKEVGTWITLDKTEVTLAPGTNEKIHFQISVPENADVGEHNGCILVQEKKDRPAGATGATLSVRTGLRVAITVPGEIVRHLELIGFDFVKRDDGSIILNPRVRNVGNVSVDAQVTVLTSYFFGKELKTHTGQFPVLRGDVSEWNFELKRPFWGGWYRSHFTVAYDKENTELGVESTKPKTNLDGSTIWFFVMPEPIALLIEGGVFILILSGVLFFVWNRRRMNMIQKTWTNYVVTSGDVLADIAHDHHVSWKLVARVNNLKSPYTLKSGMKLKVPPTK